MNKINETLSHGLHLCDFMTHSFEFADLEPGASPCLPWTEPCSFLGHSLSNLIKNKTKQKLVFSVLFFLGILKFSNLFTSPFLAYHY